VERILVVRRGGLGDTLLMLPALRALRAAQPAAELHAAGVREHVDVLVEFGAADAALSSEDLQAWALAAGGEAAARARARCAGYACVFADDPLFAALAGPRCRVQVFEPRPEFADRHAAQQICEQFGLPFEARGFALPPPVLAADAPIALAPGSGSPQKCWPRERWLELARQLAAQRRIAVVVGPVERERDDPTRWPWPAGCSFLADLSVTALAHALRAARAVVANDSGVAHLSAALSVPTIAIFGPTDPRVWAPQGRSVLVLCGSGDWAPDVAVAAVAAALLATER
jgi:ADP-heptose:LPS heptosyltransferase